MMSTSLSLYLLLSAPLFAQSVEMPVPASATLASPASPTLALPATPTLVAPVAPPPAIPIALDSAQPPELRAPIPPAPVVVDSDKGPSSSFTSSMLVQMRYQQTAVTIQPGLAALVMQESPSRL